MTSTNPPTPSRPVVGRLAPSPTGGLHLGHARTFLVAWLSARSQGGRVILRLEDLDATRARPESAASILADLRWLGIDWDEGPDLGGPSAPYVQSSRTDLYLSALNQLIDRNQVYPCTCTRADILRAASAPHSEDEGPTYPGTCAHRSADDAHTLLHTGHRFAWRFRVRPGLVSWIDRFRGPMAVDPSQVGGDFVVARPSVGSSYQLAVVVDDAAMDITEVIRGDDLIASTPRQILLYQTLGIPCPSFAHIPLVLNSDGQRLAKRDQSPKLANLRESGKAPDDLLGQLAQSCGWSQEPGPGSASSYLTRFRWDSIPRSPVTLPVILE